MLIIAFWNFICSMGLKPANREPIAVNLFVYFRSSAAGFLFAIMKPETIGFKTFNSKRTYSAFFYYFSYGLPVTKNVRDTEKQLLERGTTNK